MNNPNIVDIVGLLSLALYILIKDVVVPLIRKANHKGGNPVNLDRLYQGFIDFKESQQKWNEKTDERLDKLEEKK